MTGEGGAKDSAAVMPALVAGIHVETSAAWMAGTSPAMTGTGGARDPAAVMPALVAGARVETIAT